MTQDDRKSKAATSQTAAESIAGATKLAFLLTLLIPLCAVRLGGATQPKKQPGTAARVQSCRKLVLTGSVKAGETWSAQLGQGWLFRIVPITPSGRGYSGWDLAISAPGESEYPDALLLATPPYGSLTEREIGTTFGLRAQDAIAWEPRRFHFLTSVKDVQQARNFYRQIMGKEASADATAELLKIIGDRTAGSVGSGQFKIVDARLTSGTADPAPYARQWALHLHQVPHTVVQPEAKNGSVSTPRGALLSIEFEVSLWLPSGWQTPKATPAACGL